MLPSRPQGPAPSPRRGHAAELLSDRYLVVHGGYDGGYDREYGIGTAGGGAGAAEHGYLADGAVLDLQTNCWRPLAAEGASFTLSYKR